jgi:hypothetical protein
MEKGKKRENVTSVIVWKHTKKNRSWAALLDIRFVRAVRLERFGMTT